MFKKFAPIIFVILFIGSCQSETKTNQSEKEVVIKSLTQTSLVVLGTVQDAGSPHIACKKACCKELFNHPDPSRKVVSLGLVDAEESKTYLFEATPDIASQLKLLKQYGNKSSQETPDGIFLTHAHIGHYAGLMYLGKEAMSAKQVPVYTMPVMKNYLETNGPWSQLVANENIDLQVMANDQAVHLTSNLSITPFTVPHRDEYSETVGFQINGPNKSALFIPDIDKWEKWDKNIIEEIAKVDYAFIDATFYDGKEINNRDISQIPHPFIIESMDLFNGLSNTEKVKIHFIHFNHTNPALNITSKQSQLILENGFNIAQIHEVFDI